MANWNGNFVQCFLIRRKPSANSRPYFLLLTNHSIFCSLFLLFLPLFPISFTFLPCLYLSLLALTCPKLPKFTFTLFFHSLNKRMCLQKVLALLSLALVISLSQCTGVCLEVALEPIELPFILSGVCSPSEANYCSIPFEVFFLVFFHEWKKTTTII